MLDPALGETALELAPTLLIQTMRSSRLIAHFFAESRNLFVNSSPPIR